MQGLFDNNIDWNEALPDIEPTAKVGHRQPDNERDVGDDGVPIKHPADLFFWQVMGVTLDRKRVFIMDFDGLGIVRYGRIVHAVVPYYKNTDGKLIPYHQLKNVSLHYTDRRIDPNYIFDSKYSKPFFDYVIPNNPSTYYEIKKEGLKHRCNISEHLDFTFATMVQGFLGTPQNTVWTCLNPDYDPLDYHIMFKEYVNWRVRSYMVDYGRDNTIDTEEVTNDMIREHSIYCREWVRQHYKNITPLVSSAAYLLVQKCMNKIPSKYHVLGNETLARILWRNAKTACTFAECVYWQINTIEQSRGGRNPSYKQMSQVTNSYIQCYYKLIRFIGEINWNFFAHENIDTIFFHYLCLDWYSIVGQLPMLHGKYQHPLHDDMHGGGPGGGGGHPGMPDMPDMPGGGGGPGDGDDKNGPTKPFVPRPNPGRNGDNADPRFLPARVVDPRAFGWKHVVI